MTRYQSVCLAARWHCEKFGYEEPTIIGVEVEDTLTGDWSFIMISYGFINKMFVTWASHFSSAQQMAALIKALSDTKKLHMPHFDDFRVNNVPQAFAEAYGLTYSPLFCNPKFAPLVRLPVSPGHPHQSGKQVHWIGMGNFGSTTRA